MGFRSLIVCFRRSRGDEDYEEHIDDLLASRLLMKLVGGETAALVPFLSELAGGSQPVELLLLGLTGSHWVLLVLTGSQCVLLGLTVFYWVSLGLAGS